MELRVKVIPKSSRSEIVGAMADGTLRVKIAAAPEKGKANDELIALVAEHFRCRKSAVQIKAGASGRTKLVSVLA